MDRWCFNPVCALSTSHPPPLHVSLRCYIDPTRLLPLPTENKRFFLRASIARSTTLHAVALRNRRCWLMSPVFIYTRTSVRSGVFISLLRKKLQTPVAGRHRESV